MVKQFWKAISLSGAAQLARAEAAGQKVQIAFERAAKALTAEHVQFAKESDIAAGKAYMANLAATKASRVAARYAEMHS